MDISDITIQITDHDGKPTLLVVFPRKPKSFEEASHYAIEALRAAEYAVKEFGTQELEDAKLAAVQADIIEKKKSLPTVDAGSVEPLVEPLE